MCHKNVNSGVPAVPEAVLFGAANAALDNDPLGLRPFRLLFRTQFAVTRSADGIVDNDGPKFVSAFEGE